MLDDHEQQAQLVYAALCEAGRPDIELGDTGLGLACRVREADGGTRPATEAEHALAQKAMAAVGMLEDPLPYTGQFVDATKLAGPA